MPTLTMYRAVFVKRTPGKPDLEVEIDFGAIDAQQKKESVAKLNREYAKGMKVKSCRKIQE